MDNYQNILVVRTDRIGDVILTTPSFEALRKTYPQAKISVLVAPETAEIVEGNPNIDEVIIDDKKKAHKGWKIFKLVSLLREKKFDLAVIFHTKNRTNLLCFLAGIPHRLGYRNNKLGFLLTKPVKDVRAEGKKHEVEYCLELLKHVGVIDADASRLFMPIRRESEEWALNFLRTCHAENSKPLICVHPAASCISKRWPAKKFAELINLLVPKYKAAIILIGGLDAEVIVREIMKDIHAPVVDAVGKTSVSQLASLLKKSHLLISNDSGPVHVAAAVGTSVVSIFGRNQAGLSPQRWRPLGKNDIVLHKEVGCSICLAHRCDIEFKCLEAITPPEALEAVDAIFKL